MSTILQALQKSKFDKSGAYPAMVTDDNKAFKLKIAITASLFVIIALLISLLYLLLNPRMESNRQPTAVKIASIAPQHNNGVSKVSFETKPLPTIVPVVVEEPIVITVAKEPVTIPAVEPAPQQITSEAPKNTDSIVSTELNYENTPEALKKRFELALLMSEIEQNEGEMDDITIEEGMNDGSDIREMSSDFQDKVPFIRYDSHMYSSVLEERWIRINGDTLKEGEFDSTGQLQLIEVQPNRSIFRLERQSFSVESLTDWKGY